MHTLETKEKFIQLRIEGKPIRAIADELKINKNTLCAWNREFADQINDAQQLALESAMQEINADSIERMRALGRCFRKFDKYLEDKSPSMLHLPSYQFLLKLDAQMNRGVPAIRKNNIVSEKEQTENPA